MFSKNIILIFLSLLFSSYSYSVRVPTLKYSSFRAFIEHIKRNNSTQEEMARIIPSDLYEYLPLMLDTHNLSNPDVINLIDDLLVGTQSITDIQLPFKAVKIGCIPLLQFLFSKGISVDAQDDLDLTLLITAVNFKQIETVKFLLRSGASLDKKDILCRTALDYAILHKNQELIDILKAPRIK